MSSGMLPKFHVRNLRSSCQTTEKHDSLIRISAPAYDTTISDNPAATLKYRDEDGDKITLGSSHELKDKLNESIPQISACPPRRKKDRMSIAMLLSEVQQNPDAVDYHTFDIEELEEIQKLWQEIQQRNKTPPPPSIEQPPSGNQTRIGCSLKLPEEDPSPEDVDKGSNGRSASTCRIRDQAVVESMLQKNEDRSNKLAAAYNRLKVEFWTPIAAELGISWWEAEALHWALGKDEMMRRAERLNPSQISSFEHPLSVEGTDGEWHEDRKKIIPASADSSNVQNLEDYRSHHFNATMPPQSRNAVPASQVAPKFAVGRAPYAGVAKSTLAKGTSPSLVAAPVVNLTTEGKRQAQAAGDILRSRTTPSRHRKAVTNMTDHTNHQNRWASYKSPNTAFSPKTSSSPSQGFSVPTLTPEGRRQAQAAGDRLRSRTNPIRHSRPSRSGSLEHGVSKNRWASYVAPRGARFEVRHHATADLKERSQSKDPGTVEQEKQPSLLEVFEAELAKGLVDSDDMTGEGQAPEPEVIDIPSAKLDLNSPSPDSNHADMPAQVASPAQRSRAVLHGVDLINDYVQRLTSAGGAQEFSNVVDHGVRAATGAVGALMRGVPGRLHDVLGQKEQSGAVQREADIKGIDDALMGLRDFVSNIASGLGGSNESVPSDSPGTNEKKGTDDESINTALDAVPTEVFSENGVGALDNVSPALSDTLSSTREEKIPPFADAGARAVANSSTDSQASSPRFLSEIRPVQQTQLNDGSPIQRKRTIFGPRYHKPGPIHLPQATPSRSNIGSPSDGFGNSAHLCQSRSTISVDKPATSPTPAATRFPTLAQFEGRDFAAATPFPALPSMEPLVPQRAAPQTVVNMLDTQTGKQLNPPNLLPEATQQHNSNATFAAKQYLLDNGINPARLSDEQISSFALQRPAVQAMSIQVYAQNMAKNQSQQKLSHDSQMELMLNGGQYRNCWLKTRQGLTSSGIDNPNTQGGGSPTVQISMAPLSKTPKLHTLQDYEMQLRLLEQQSKKRWPMAQEERKEHLKDESGTQSLAKQQLPVERPNEEHTALASGDQGASYNSPQLAGRVPHTRALEDQCTNAAAAETSGQSEEHEDQAPFDCPASSSAARLAEPFDPLDVEPSARPHLTQGIRRNVTVAGTGSRHNARRRRPYSEAFDGVGRVPWESFEGAAEHEDHDSRKLSGTNLTTRRREQAMKGRDRHQRRQGQIRRSATLHESRLASPFRGYDDEHQDDSTVDKVNSCVSQLMDLGFGSEEDGSGDRLLVYAQAAEGDLVEAIDMIDEEQRAYRRL